MELNALKEIIENDSNLYQLFKGCPFEILNHFETREYPAGTVICRQSEIIDRLFIIIEGYADIYYLAENGRRYSIITLKKGDVVGEIEILEQRPYSANMEAYSDLKTLEISRAFFMKWIGMDQNINLNITRILSDRFYHLVSKAGKDTLYTLKYRLCAYLLSRGRQLSQKTTSVELKLDKEKLSEEFAVTSRSINRILRSLHNKEILEIRANSIIIKDLEKLAKEENCYDI